MSIQHRTFRSGLLLAALLLSVVPQGAAQQPCSESGLCTFDQATLSPSLPRAGQEFSVLIEGELSGGIDIGSPVVTGGLITVPVACDTGAGIPPGKRSFVRTVDLPGLPAGPATVEFLKTDGRPECVLASLAFDVAPAAIPTLSTWWKLLFALLLGASAWAVQRASPGP